MRCTLWLNAYIAIIQRKITMSQTPADYFDLSTTDYASLFDGVDCVWEVIPRIAPYIQMRLNSDLEPNITSIDLPPTTVYQSPDIYIGKNVRIEPHVYIQGPAIIDDDAFLGHGAFIRANTFVGKNAIVGHATETKNSVLLEESKAPHFSYVGDSILGQRVNLGAGTKLSNFPVKFMNLNPLPTIQIMIDGDMVDTGLSKFGAILGDDVQLGCNSVTNPGVLVGARTWVYPMVSLAKGIYPADQVIKLRQTIEVSSKH
jgi:UDP-N-acetylglucosamine diphosphorylase / glucose-1-phosphate thymidylyltransferase / UDP-N-acetylgalactosamine diphosphorylase / glucosamine-1-phosphate N-acetyltransferase / galactosamine-1-phosphate N-acetyltransferase